MASELSFPTRLGYVLHDYAQLKAPVASQKPDRQLNARYARMLMQERPKVI